MLHPIDSLDSKDAFVPSEDPFYAILDQMREVHDRKSKDYGNKTDRSANFRCGVPYGVPAWLYALLRVEEKLIRVQSFIQNGKLECEGMEETLIDCANLCVLSLCLFLENPMETKILNHLGEEGNKHPGTSNRS